MSDIIDPIKLKVTELRAELQERGLDTKGNKPVLVERLREALEAEQTTGANGEEEEPTPEEELVAEEEQPEEVDEQPEKPEENGQEKEYFEDAPVEDVDDDEKEQCQEDEDKSGVDLIKDDFFNGNTEELQGLEEEEDVKEEMTADIKEEDELKTEMMEASGDAEETWDHKRGRKRAGSPVKEEDEAESKKTRHESDVLIIAPPAAADEDAFDQSKVVLDWYNSDLSLKINKEERLSAAPLKERSFAYMWHGVRATYGFTSGRVMFEVELEHNCVCPHLEESEQHPYVVRVGWSVDNCGFTLGEEPRSWGYGGTGKASTNLKFKDYGGQFQAGDVVGAYLDLDVQPAVMSFTINGVNQGICYEIRSTELGGQALFPHILTKNIAFKVNFGDEDAWSTDPLDNYTFAGHIPLADRVQGSLGPTRREDCEVIMMVGLPAVGKTTWVQNYCHENRHMKYNVLGTNDLIDKMKVNGLPRKANYAGRWDQLISLCTKGLNELLKLGYKRKRNYIVDQTNVYPTAQKRKIRGFGGGFKRRAVVICPTDEDLKLRTQKREKEEGKDVPDSAVLEMKANFKLPEEGEFFESVEYIEMVGDEAQALVAQYNDEGAAANPNKNYGNRGGGGRSFGGGAGKRDYNSDRGGSRDNRGYRGGWDRNYDRRGGYDRRDRGSSGGGGGSSWNRNSRDFSGRLGTGGGTAGGWNRDSRSGGGYNRDDNRDDRSTSTSRGGGYNRDSRGGSRNSYPAGGSNGGGYYNRYQDTSSYSSGDSSYQSSSSSSGYSSSGYGSQPSTGYGSYSAATPGGYQQNYSQGYYGQQQQQPYYPQSQTTAYRTDTSAYGSWPQQTQQQWPAATTAAAPAATQQNTWNTSYQQQQQGAQPTWGQQSYATGYNYGYKK